MSVYLPVINWTSILEQSKTIQIAGAVVTGCHFCWKLLRWLSLSGKSKNPWIRRLHQVLRKYLNCGLLIRSQFGVRLPWQYLFFPGSYWIVNYGSYGTVPNKVMDFHNNLLKEFEVCPDMFYRITLEEKYIESLDVVSKAVGCASSNVVFVKNLTEGMNCALNSFLTTFDHDDAILCISVAYSSVLNTAKIIAKNQHVPMYVLELKFPIDSEGDVCRAFDKMFQTNRNIRLAIFDHITSASATLLPIEKIAKVCAKYDVISVVDGAHAPGQLQLDIESYGVDVYIGNLHKWYYTPKSCAVMYVHPRHHYVIQPSVISHGCYGDLQERFRRQGTRSYCDYITAGYAVGDFMESLGGIEFLHSYITPLVEFAAKLFAKEWGTKQLQIPDSMKAPYMRIVFLPAVYTRVGGPTQDDADRMILEILNKYNVAIFINPIDGRQAVRVTAQIFSTKAEYVTVANIIRNEAMLMEKSEVYM